MYLNTPYNLAFSWNTVRKKKAIIHSTSRTIWSVHSYIILDFLIIQYQCSD